MLGEITVRLESMSALSRFLNPFQKQQGGRHMFSHSTIEDPDLLLTFTSRASRSLHVVDLMSFIALSEGFIYSLMKTAGLGGFWRPSSLHEIPQYELSDNL